MKRRRFLKLGVVIGASVSLDAKSPTGFRKAFSEVSEIIETVLGHIFPAGSRLPSARETGLSAFVYETIAHPSYDRDIRAFVIEGARELDKRTKGKLTEMGEKELEQALRAYEATEYGDGWLGRMMTLGLEGLLSDPIYGANPKEAGWRALETEGGQPRPSERYLGS